MKEEKIQPMDPCNQKPVCYQWATLTPIFTEYKFYNKKYSQEGTIGVVELDDSALGLVQKMMLYTVELHMPILAV